MSILSVVCVRRKASKQKDFFSTGLSSVALRQFIDVFCERILAIELLWILRSISVNPDFNLVPRFTLIFNNHKRKIRICRIVNSSRGDEVIELVFFCGQTLNIQLFRHFPSNFSPLCWKHVQGKCFVCHDIRKRHKKIAVYLGCWEITFGWTFIRRSWKPSLIWCYENACRIEVFHLAT